jgi:hypothetical protein
MPQVTAHQRLLVISLNISLATPSNTTSIKKKRKENGADRMRRHYMQALRGCAMHLTRFLT